MCGGTDKRNNIPQKEGRKGGARKGIEEIKAKNQAN